MMMVILPWLRKSNSFPGTDKLPIHYLKKQKQNQKLVYRTELSTREQGEGKVGFLLILIHPVPMGQSPLTITHQSTKNHQEVKLSYHWEYVYPPNVSLVRVHYPGKQQKQTTFCENRKISYFQSTRLEGN